MKITVADQNLLVKAYEEMSDLVKLKEDGFKQLLLAMNGRPLSSHEAIEILEVILRIEQIYFKVIPITTYVEEHPNEFERGKKLWNNAVMRIKKLYHESESLYMATLAQHAKDILIAFNTTHQRPRIFAGDAKYVKQTTPPLNGGTVICKISEQEHKQFKFETKKDLIKAALKNIVQPLTQLAETPTGMSKTLAHRLMTKAFLYSAQLQVESFIIMGSNLDHSLLNELNGYAQQKYNALKNLHEPINIWLDILTKATKTAQQNMRPVFNEIEVRGEQIERAERTAVKIIVGAICSPASRLVDPVFDIIQALSEGGLTGNAFTRILNKNIQGTNSKAATKQLGSFVQWALNTEIKTDPIRAIAQNLENNHPNTTLEWIKKYMDYKINGPKIFAEMFQIDTDVWNNASSSHHKNMIIKPIDIIKAKRRELMDKYKTLNLTFEALCIKVKYELQLDFHSSINTIFDSYESQYAPAKGLRDIVNYITQKTFDDNKSGLASFDRNNHNQLINVIANELKLAGLLRFAMTYEPFWGGNANPSDAHLKAINDGTFKPEMNGHIGINRNWKTDILNKAIYECYLESQPGPQDKLHNPFIDHDFFHDFRCKHFKTLYTPGQAARFNKIQMIMHEYFHTPIDTRLLKSIESRLSKRGPKAPHVALLQEKITAATLVHKTHMEHDGEKNALLPVTQAIDKIHDWKSAESLVKEANNILKPYIATYLSDADAIKAQTEYAKAKLFPKILLLRNAKLNMQIEEAKKKAESTPPEKQGGFFSRKLTYVIKQ